MSTPTTPPPFETAARPPAPERPSAPQSGDKTVAIVVSVIGGVALLGAAVGAGVSAARGAAAGDELLTADARGVQALSVDASASSFSVAYADVDEAVLEVTAGAGGGWSLSRRGGELIVDRRGGLFGGWSFGDWFGDGEDTAVLTLPEGLRDASLDADLSLGGGSLTAEGTFGDVQADVGAGYLSLEGAARSLDLDLSAGQAEVTLAGVERADFSIAAGRVDAVMRDEAPTEVSVDVSAGSLDLALPDVEYAVTSDVAAGDLDNQLDVSSASPHHIQVELAAGDATLRPGGR